MDEYILQSGSHELALVLGEQPGPGQLGDRQVVVRVTAAGLFKTFKWRGAAEAE
ncbi:hypothetical protein ACN2C7_06220 [Caulobacter sp. ErkDOM-E]|uniref:hypothetical protein n=1 Tax=Caulobacter sp. ErkDOM-E TaxID=3402778 RepID=UPI003AF4CE76